MSCDLDNLATRLNSILKLGSDGFSRWVICDLLIKPRRQTAGNRLHYPPNSVLSHSCFRVPSITCWSGNYRQVKRTGFLASASQIGAPATLPTISRDLSRLGPPTTSAEESGVLDFSALLVSFSSDFLWILLPCYHLPSGNAEILDISFVMVVSLWSQLCRRDFEAYFCQRKAIVVSKFAFSPENFCFAVWLCFVWAFSFTLPWRRSWFAFALSVFRLCEVTTGYNAH